MIANELYVGRIDICRRLLLRIFCRNSNRGRKRCQRREDKVASRDVIALQRGGHPRRFFHHGCFVQVVDVGVFDLLHFRGDDGVGLGRRFQSLGHVGILFDLVHGKDVIVNGGLVGIWPFIGMTGALGEGQ